MNTSPNRIKYGAWYCLVSALLIVLALSLIVQSGPALAQPKQPSLKDIIKEPEDVEQAPKEVKPETEVPKAPRDDFGRGTPRTSVKGFFTAARERDFEKAVKYLDLRNLPKGFGEEEGQQLARHLKIVLDHSVWIDLEELSNDPKGHLDDGLPSYRDLVCRIKTPEKEVDILVQRIPRGDGVYIWQFSSKTVAQIPELYEHYGYGYLERYLPAAFFDLEFMGIEAWMWVSIVIFACIGYLVAVLITTLVTFILNRTRFGPSRRLKRFITGPIRFLLALLILQGSVQLLNPSPTIQALIRAHTLFIIIATWLVMGLLDFIFDSFVDRLRREDQRSTAVVFIPPLRNAAKIIIIVIAIIIWLDNIGFKVTTLLAGLGVGSIALALAAQKSIENLFGAITLYTSKPVRVGDFCKFADKLGTVEEIGLRATRIRTLDNTLVTVPNGEFMNLHIDNFSKREKFLYRPRISLRYETTPDQIRSILTEIKKLLTSHPKVLSDPARVRFINFGTYSLDLDIFAYIDQTDYSEYLTIAEDLNLQIMDIVTKAGSSFAFPSQTTYLESGAGLDKDLAKAAESLVKEDGTP